MSFPGGPGDPFGGAPFGQHPGGQQPYQPSYGGPPIVSAPQQPPSAGKVNTLATLSLVFAFVFAPAGAVLGHLGLAQIKRTGERGRERALIGMILSYVFIALAVLALVVVLVIPDDSSSTAATSATSTTTTTTTTTTTKAGPGPVQQSQLTGLLLSVDEIKQIANAPNQFTVADRDTIDGSEGIVATPPECLSAVFSGLESVYRSTTARATAARELNTTVRSGIVGMVERVVMFDNGLAATGQVQQIVGTWRGCAGRTVTLVIDNGEPNRYDLGQVTTAGQAPQMYVLRSTFQGSAPGFVNYRVVAAKANIVVEIGLFGYDVGDGPQAIASAILGRIPG